MKIITLILGLVTASSAYADMQNTVVGEVYGAKVNLARVQEQVTLVQSQKGESDLRVSFLVMDAGGSTDLSPRARLLLTTFNESEMRDALSIHRISHINELVSTKRESAGIYSAIVTMYNFDSICPQTNNLTVKVKLTVDARQLTIDVRNFKDVEEFDVGTIQTPVTVTTECI